MEHKVCACDEWAGFMFFSKIGSSNSSRSKLLSKFGSFCEFSDELIAVQGTLLPHNAGVCLGGLKQNVKTGLHLVWPLQGSVVTLFWVQKFVFFPVM